MLTCKNDIYFTWRDQKAESRQREEELLLLANKEKQFQIADNKADIVWKAVLVAFKLKKKKKTK